MKQITEDYVSYETAVLLKEKGFDECCGTAYTTTEGYPIRVMGATYSLERNSGYDDFHYSMPSQSVALKWLREVHNIHIEIRYLPNQFTDEPSYKAMIWDMSEEIGRPIPDDIEYMFYETCVNEAIKYTLENLI